MPALSWVNGHEGAIEMGIAGLGEVAERVRRYTVLVQPGGRGSGSGVIWNSDGTIANSLRMSARAIRGVILRLCEFPLPILASPCRRTPRLFVPEKSPSRSEIRSGSWAR
jgi:hypothetical protein